MRILFIVNKWPQALDGVADYTCQLAKHLHDAGMAISVVCAKPEGYSLKPVTGIRLHAVIDRWNSKKTWRVLRSIISQEKPDRIIWQYVPYGFHPYGIPFRLPRLVRKCQSLAPTYIFFHEVRIKINPKRWKSWVIGWPMKWVSKRLVKAAQGVATSNAGYQRLLGPKGKVEIIPISSNFSLSESAGISKETAKEELGLKGKFVIGSFGMGVRGQKTLIDAFAELAQTSEGLVLYLIGGINSKVQKSILDIFKQKGIQDHIHFSGYLPENEVLKHLNTLDLYTMLEPSSSRDTWTGTSTRSGTLAAALALGKVVIGVEGELTSPTLKNAIFIIKNLDQKDLVGAIESLRTNKELAESFSKEAKKYHDHQLSWESAIKKYRTWIES